MLRRRCCRYSDRNSRRDILAVVLLNPDCEYSLTDLARRFDAPLSTVHGEVKRLTESELFQRRHVGRSALVKSNLRNRLVEPLTQLLFLSWGPRQVVAEEFSGVVGAEQVLIFGSWAARFLQREQGPPPHDLDVLVVGQPQRRDVYDAARPSTAAPGDAGQSRDPSGGDVARGR